METKKTLRDIYSFPGFRARATLKTHPDDPDGRTVRLERRQKKRFASAVAHKYQRIGTAKPIEYGTWMPGQPAFILNSSTAGLNARTVSP